MPGIPLKRLRLESAHAVLSGLGETSNVTFGWTMWGEATEFPDRGEGSHRNNKFCRSSGKLLRALMARGMADFRWDGPHKIWFATGTVGVTR